MKQILTFIIFALTISIAKADCLACWQLRKIEITLNNGEIVRGFIRWNESGFQDSLFYSVWHNKFPENLVPYYQSLKYEQKIVLYKEIFVLKNDSIDEFFATKEECILNLDYRQIKSVKEIDKELKKYEGAGDVPILTQHEMDKLKTNPLATFSINISVADIYFISYSPDITRTELSKLNESNFDQMAPQLKSEGVIIYTVSYD